MKNDDQMYQSVLSRYEEHQKKKKKRILAIKRIVPVLACFCYVSIAGIIYWQNNEILSIAPTVKVIDDTSATETSASTSVITPENTITSSKNNSVSTSADISFTSSEVKVTTSKSTATQRTRVNSETSQLSSDDAVTQKQDIKTEPVNTPSITQQNITTTLATAIETSPQGGNMGSDFVAKTTATDPDSCDDYVITHTSSDSNQSAAGTDYNTAQILDKLEILLKEGEYLQYGEALYTTGTPDGEKWSKEYYQQRMEFYGKEFLEKYIVNGKFLRYKVEADITDIKSMSKNSSTTTTTTTSDKSEDINSNIISVGSDNATTSQPMNEKYSLGFLDEDITMYRNTYRISPDNVSDYIGTASMRALTEPIYYAKAFKIKNIEVTMAIAVKFEEDDGYYLYRSNETPIDTIKELIPPEE